MAYTGKASSSLQSDAMQDERANEQEAKRKKREMAREPTAFNEVALRMTNAAFVNCNRNGRSVMQYAFHKFNSQKCEYIRCVANNDVGNTPACPV